MLVRSLMPLARNSAIRALRMLATRCRASTRVGASSRTCAAKASQRAAEQTLQLAKQAADDDLVLVLLSGGVAPGDVVVGEGSQKLFPGREVVAGNP